MDLIRGDELKFIKRVFSLAVGGIIVLCVAFFLSGGNIQQLKEFVNEFDQEVELETNEVIINRVIDGDTIIVNTDEGIEERVRLLLIDTPESVHPSKEKELFGEEASDYAKEFLQEGDIVTLEIGNPERDKYDRLLAYVWVEDVNFNQLMIEKGFARVGYVYEPNTKYLDEFERAEQDAKEKELNIWSIEGYVTEKGFDMSVVD